NLVRTEATTTLGEIVQVNAPSVLIELAFHDNPEDAAWIKSSLDASARVIVLALTEYFDIPFFETENRRPGVVDVEW
ncbi:peptidoglycan hydrolase, partial [Xanthomonas citri pv. citri]|nr:peptidoglycan hydrolase [Xanthomonas citri pv. citri]